MPDRCDGSAPKDAAMKPGLIMVIDQRPARAEACVAGMLEALGAVGHRDVQAMKGEHWAAAIAAPPARVPGCSAGVVSEDDHILLYTGDIDLGDTSPPAHATSDAVGRELLRRLRQDGLQTLATVDGAFCGAWYDGPGSRWVVFNDRLGLLPIFHTWHERRLIITPSATLTWRAADMPLAVSEDGVSDLLRSMNMTEDHTLIESVHWLRGGHAIICKPRNSELAEPQVRKYWEFRHQPARGATLDDAMDEYVHAMGEAIDRQTDGALAIVLGLSGGMDSRLILARACELGRTPTCFTTGWPFSEDVRFARQLACKARATHMIVPLEAALLPDRLERLIIETDGLHSARHMVFGSAIPDYLACFSGSVLLEGHIHGIVGGGCVPDDDDLPIGKPAHACKWARKHAHGGGDVETISSLLLPDIARATDERWRARIDDRYANAPGDDSWQKAEYAAINGRSGRNDVLGPGLQRRDVVLRSPATSRAVLDWAARTPGPWRRGKQLYMEVLRRRYPRLARVRKADYNGLPLAGGTLLREYCWQREKISRWWAHHTYPQTRAWGTGAGYTAAIAFETWRQHGGLARLVEPDARVLAWVKEDRLHDLWHDALRDPTTSSLLLTLGTIETYIRHLEQCSPLNGLTAVERVRFQTIATRMAKSEEAVCAPC